MVRRTSSGLRRGRVTVAAGFGALLGIAVSIVISGGHSPWGWMVAVLLISLASGVIVGVGVKKRCNISGGGVEAAGGDRDSPRPDPVSVRSMPAATMAAAPSAGEDPVPGYVVMPVDPPSDQENKTPGWWSATGPPPAADARPVTRRDIPDLSAYVGGGQIVSCVACGEFAVDVWRTGTALRFRCQHCQHLFSWARGEPWPAWKVDPRSRRRA